MSNRLPILAAEIADEHLAVTVAAGEFVKHAVEAGQRLLEAKGLVPHGEWQNWLRANVPMVSSRTAQRYMRAAKRLAKNDTMAFSTLKQILDDEPADADVADQVADILNAWAEANPATQQWFRDLVQIVGANSAIPQTYLEIDPRLVRNAATALRRIEVAA